MLDLPIFMVKRSQGRMCVLNDHKIGEIYYFVKLIFGARPNGVENELNAKWLRIGARH